MRLAILSEHFPSVGDPSYVFVQQLVFAIVDQGVEVIVIAPQSITHVMIRGGKFLPKFSTERSNLGTPFHVYRPYDISFGNRWARFTKYTDFVFNSQLNRILDDFHPDALYGHFWNVANRLKPYALRHSLPLFVACGEGDYALEQLLDSMSVKQRNELVSAVHGVISVSSENKRKCILYKLAFEENVAVFPNGVDETLFHPKDASYLRSKLGVSSDDFLILFVGGFIERKGAHRLSKAIDILNNNRIKVIFIGKPMEGDSALPSCAGIVYQGVVEHNLLPDYYNAADLFVLPTLREGCSNAIVEALSCGLPVVSSNLPFNSDILNENNSILVDPNSVEDISKAIDLLMNNRDLYRQKKQYTVAHSRQFSIVTRASKILSFIEKRCIINE